MSLSYNLSFLNAHWSINTFLPHSFLYIETKIHARIFNISCLFPFLRLCFLIFDFWFGKLLLLERMILPSTKKDSPTFLCLELRLISFLHGIKALVIARFWIHVCKSIFGRTTYIMFLILFYFFISVSLVILCVFRLGFCSNKFQLSYCKNRMPKENKEKLESKTERATHSNCRSSEACSLPRIFMVVVSEIENCGIVPHQWEHKSR